MRSYPYAHTRTYQALGDNALLLCYGQQSFGYFDFAALKNENIRYGIPMSTSLSIAHITN